METHSFALKYRQQRYSVIPLKSGSKVPLLNSWEPYQKTIASEGQLDVWFSNGHAGNNIAIVTGRISGIIAFDTDGQEALANFNRAVDEQGLGTILNETMHIKTASGNTNIVFGFRIEEFTSAEDDKLLANRVLWTNGKHSEIRVKGEGGYIVAPPSTFAERKRYELIDGKSTVTILSKAQIDAIISAIQKQTQHPVVYRCSPIDTANADLTEEDVPNIVVILKPYYQHGNRNDFTMYLSGLMRKEGISFNSALKVIESIAAYDEEKSDRIRTLEETYKKEDLDGISGYAGLLSILVNQTQSEEKAHWVQNIMHHQRVLFTVHSKSFEGTARIVDKYTDSKLAEEVSNLMHTNYGWSDGLIVELAPSCKYF